MKKLLRRFGVLVCSLSFFSTYSQSANWSDPTPDSSSAVITPSVGPSRDSGKVGIGLKGSLLGGGVETAVRVTHRKRSGDELQSLLTVDPRSVTALRALGYVELKTGNFDLARKYFTQANRIRPEARTHYYLGLLENSGSMVTRDSAQPQLESVREHMASCLAQEPTFAAAFDLQGHALAAQDRLRDSLEAFQQAANLGPRIDSYTLDLAEMELRLGLAAPDTWANLTYLLESTDAAVAARAAELMASKESRQTASR